MRCETSFFSLTLFQKHLKRNWPMWAVWLVIWLLAIPVTLWNESDWRSAESIWALARGYPEMLPAMSTLIALAAPIVAVAVFFHLFKAPAANFIGALPMRREGVFATAFSAGYAMLTVPLAAVALVTLAVEGVVGYVDAGAIFSWLGGCMLLSFFWFSFASLCCVISGNGVAAVCFYAIFNGVVAVMVWLVQQVLQGFLYGFDQFSDGLWETVFWLTPIVRTSGSVFYTGSDAGVGQFEMYWMYAAVGFLMLLAALGLHHIRKAERAGDLIAFRAIRWVFRVSVTLCGGLSLGMLLAVILFSSSESVFNGAFLAGCCAVAAAISWFAAEMLLQKSLHVFKTHWKGAAVGAVCFILAICAIDMDWIGFTRRVPRAEQVRSATAIFYGEVDYVAGGDGLTYDGETVQALIDLHQYLADNQNTHGSEYSRVEIAYDLGLTKLRRAYAMDFEWGDETAAVRAAAVEAGTPVFDMSRGTPRMGYFSNNNDGGVGRDLSTDEVSALWTAIGEDVAAGRYRADGDRAWREKNVTLEFAWRRADGGNIWQQFYPREGCAATWAVIEELGLLDWDPEAEHPEIVTVPGEDVPEGELPPGVDVPAESLG